MARYIHRGNLMINRLVRGFTYLGLLFILAMMSIILAMAGSLWSFTQNRQKEKELIFVGNQFRNAIGQYYEKTPGTIKRYPQTLDQLLEDNRYVSLQRHLRKIYRDPMSESYDWGIIKSPEGGIIGIYSKSKKRSIRLGVSTTSAFMLGTPTEYSNWKFIYPPLQIQKTFSN